VALISIEEDTMKIGENVLANASDIANQKISWGKNLSADDWCRLSDAAGGFKGMPFWVEDAALHISAVEAAVSTLVAKHQVKLVVVDYLQLVVPQNTRGGTREAEVRAMSNGLKLLFKRLGVAGVVLAQLNRESGTGVPVLHNLRESGAIEQDGDLIVLLHREDAHHQANPDNPGYVPDNKLEAIVAKNKDGRTGVVPLYFDGAHQRIGKWEGGVV
jgi:replicative DNA helicase